MATATKHMERSHRNHDKNERGKFWFFNQSAFMARDKAAKKKTLREMLKHA